MEATSLPQCIDATSSSHLCFLLDKLPVSFKIRFFHLLSLVFRHLISISYAPNIRGRDILHSNKHFETTLFMAIENFIFKQVFVLLFIIQLSRLKGKKKKSLSPSPRLQAVNWKHSSAVGESRSLQSWCIRLLCDICD